MLFALLGSCFVQQSPLTLFTNNNSAVIAIQQDTLYAECKQVESAIITLLASGTVENSIQLSVKFPAISFPIKYVFPNIQGAEINFAILAFYTHDGLEKQLVQQIRVQSFDLHDCISITYAYVSPYRQYLSFLLTIGNLSVCPDFVSFEKSDAGSFKYVEHLRYITQYDGKTKMENLLENANVRLVSYDEDNPCEGDDHVLPSYDKSVQLVHCCNQDTSIYDCTFRYKQMLQAKRSYFYIQAVFRSRYGQRYVLYDIESLHNSPEYSHLLISVNMTLLNNSFYFECASTPLSQQQKEYLSGYSARIAIACGEEVFLESEYLSAEDMFNNWILDCGEDAACRNAHSELKSYLNKNSDLSVKYMIYIYYQDKLTIQQRIGVFISRSSIFVDAKEIQQIYVLNDEIVINFTVSEARYLQKVPEVVQFRVYDRFFRTLHAHISESFIFHSANTWVIRNQSLVNLLSTHSSQFCFILEDSRGRAAIKTLIVSQQQAQLKWLLMASGIGIGCVVLLFITSQVQLSRHQAPNPEQYWSQKKEE